MPIDTLSFALIWLTLGSLAINTPLEARPPDQASPAGLLTNLLSRPEKTLITTATPAFSWIVPATATDDAQSAYRILVATAPELLREGKADLWDSDRIASDQSLHIRYAGKALASGQSAWWTVRTWNRDGRPSAYATPHKFNIGRTERSADKWPGESRWVRLADENGEQRWTFENRHPVAYHKQAPTRSVSRPGGVTFLDFGQAAFAGLQLELSWTPAPGSANTTRIEVVVGEKARPDGESIDSRPGGGVIYRRYPLDISPVTRVYTVEFPRFVPKYPHSQAMPPHMPEVVPFRYCELRPCAEKVSVVSARRLALWYEFDDEVASFSSSSPDLDKVYQLCKYSLKVNTFNGDFASSERERMMYEADTFIQQMGHYAADREFAIARYSVENMLYHGSWPTEWISHCLLMVWADYWHTGDSSLLARHYETLKPKTLTALAREDGLISTRTGLQTREFLASIHAPQLRDIVDWPTHMADGFEFLEYNSVVNAFHYRSLVLMARIGGELGLADDQAFYAARAEKVRASFQEAFFDPASGLYRDGIGSEHKSFHANLFALAFGLVPAERQPALIAWLKSRGMACGVYPAHYVLETFFDHDEADHALSLLTSDSDRGWLNMLRMGSTVTTEAWDMKYKHNISWTHAWSASPAHIIPRKLMGIEPASPGFGRVNIRPRLASLEQATVKLPTIRGDIRLSVLNRPAQNYTLDVALPANVRARVFVPVFARSTDDVLVDGVTVQARRDGQWLELPEIGSGPRRIERLRQ